MRLAVFRAAEDGLRTAAALARLGHEAVLASVIRIVPTGVTVPVASADALIFTSAHAPEALARHPDGIGHLIALPCWCVGERTSDAARQAGFTRISTAGGDAARLAAAIVAGERAARFALVAGRDRKPDLEAALGRAGLTLGVVEAYAAEAVQGWDAAIVANLSEMEGALHYSQRSAMLAFHLAEGTGLGDSFRVATHFCLSEDIRAALRGAGAGKVQVATRPDEASMLALVGRL